MTTQSLSSQMSRPGVGRNLGLSHRLARTLSQTGLTPNQISVGGLLASFLALALWTSASMLETPLATWILGLGGVLMVQLRLLCNLFDGMVAQNNNQASHLGALYNELPDRLSDVATCVGVGLFTDQLALGLALAVASILVAYLRVLGQALAARHDFGGLMPKQVRAQLLCALVLLALLAQWSAAGWLIPVLPYLFASILAGTIWTLGQRAMRLHGALKQMDRHSDPSAVKQD